MKPFEPTEELTDRELTQMLSTWTVPVPSDKLRARFFAERPLFLAYATVAEPWYKVLFQAGRQSRSFAAALVLQMCALAFCLVTISAPVIRHIVKQSDIIFLNPYHARLPQSASKPGGGGGGGQHAPTPVSQGEAPEFAHKTFIPPAMAVPKPLLPVVPTITATAPQIEATNYGDPLSKLPALSPGQGVNGLGDGKNGGVGQGDGTGYHDGQGGGTNGNVYAPGGEVSTPILIAKYEPEYSDEARRAKLSGSVLLSVVVDENGIPRNIRIVRSLGLGLDQRAIDAVTRWRFRPGLRHGKPVAVQAAVEVIFRLL